MSRAAGVQRDIIDVVRKDRRGYVSVAELRERFPRRSRQRSLHRAIRSLVEQGRVRVAEVKMRRYVVLVQGGRNRTREPKFPAECAEAVRQLELVCRARGVEIPADVQDPREIIAEAEPR